MVHAFKQASCWSSALWRPRGRIRLATAFGAIVTISAWPTPPALSQQRNSESAPSAQEGARIFGAKGCSGCHAIDGIGGTAAPDLTRTRPTRSFYALAADMWNHIPAMIDMMDEAGIGRPRLAPEEMASLAVYLFTVQESGAAGDSAAGRTLFLEKRCVMCHQVGGIGGVVGPALDRAAHYRSSIEVAAAMWNHGPEMAEVMKSRSIERGTLTGRELADLLAYLSRSGQAMGDASPNVLPGSVAQGRKLYRAKACAECHGDHGQGGLGPNLARRELDWSLTDFAAAMWNKAPAMISEMSVRGVHVPELTSAEMADIVAYLYSLRFFEASGDPAIGRSEIRSKGCVDCHTLAGAGRGSASELVDSSGWDSPASVIAALWNHTTVAEAISEDHQRRWPLFDDEEIAHLVAFFQSR